VTDCQSTSIEQPGDQILSNLGRRERQIMDIIVRRGRAAAAAALADFPYPPSYASTRGVLRLLGETIDASPERDEHPGLTVHPCSTTLR